MFEKFTERSRKVFAIARQRAQQWNSEFIGPEYILLGLLDEGGGVAAKFLASKGVDRAKVEAEVREQVTPSTSPTVTLGQLPFSPGANRVIVLAGEAASQGNVNVIGTGHLLAALFRHSESIASRALSKLGMAFSWIDELLKLESEISSEAIDEKPPWDPNDVGMQWVIALAEGFQRAGCKNSPIVPDPEVIRKCIEDR